MSSLWHQSMDSRFLNWQTYELTVLVGQTHEDRTGTSGDRNADDFSVHTTKQSGPHGVYEILRVFIFDAHALSLTPCFVKI